MSEETMNKENSPVLTFGDAFTTVTGEQGTVKTEVPEEEKQVDLNLDDSMLSEEEKNAIVAFSQQIDLKNTTAILEYGAGAQKKTADFAEQVITQVKTKDLGEVGELLIGVVNEVQVFNDGTEKKGFLGLFKKGQEKLEVIKAKYDKAENNISKICDNLENHQVTLLKDVEILDEMYALNLNSYKEVTMYIIAGKNKLDEVRNGELKELQKKAEESGQADDAQAARDLAEQCNRFEKKLYDLDISRSVSMQTAPQIRLCQSADTQMAEKIQTVLVNTIPLWKNQMVLALSTAHTAEAIKAENAVTNATNELLMKNAETLQIASTQAAKANERGIVDIETLRATNAKLIDTLAEVKQIQEEGRKNREAAEIELRKMEDELKTKLLEMSQDGQKTANQ